MKEWDIQNNNIFETSDYLFKCTNLISMDTKLDLKHYQISVYDKQKNVIVNRFYGEKESLHLNLLTNYRVSIVFPKEIIYTIDLSDWDNKEIQSFLIEKYLEMEITDGYADFFVLLLNKFFKKREDLLLILKLYREFNLENRQDDIFEDLAYQEVDDISVIDKIEIIYR